MAYSFSVKYSDVRLEDAEYLIIEITESGGGASDIWEALVPSVFTMTLFDATLSNPGSATQISPILFFSSDGTDPFDPLVENDETIQTWIDNPSRVRNQTLIRGLALGGVLRGQSRPDATATEVLTRITLRVGHV